MHFDLFQAQGGPSLFAYSIVVPIHVVPDGNLETTQAFRTAVTAVIKNNLRVNELLQCIVDYQTFWTEKCQIIDFGTSNSEEMFRIFGELFGHFLKSFSYLMRTNMNSLREKLEQRR